MNFSLDSSGSIKQNLGYSLRWTNKLLSYDHAWKRFEIPVAGRTRAGSEWESSSLSVKCVFKSWFEWKQIVNIPQVHPSVHMAVLSLRSIDTYVLHRSVILESYIAEALKLKSKYRTEVTEEPFILKAQLTDILTCFLSELDTVDVADVSSWAPELVAFFHSRGTFPLELFSPTSVVWAHRCHRCLRCLRTSLEVSHLPSLSHLMV